ncbi:MAG TPA: SH3 domain-containing protein [Ardenticatenaceae bacterium]|nr:SH3 domain-containing protein [Ardenticatenaceae bacterium]
MTSEQALPAPKRRSRINWAPYWLILPTVIYLALFFIWPMIRGLGLAIWDDDAALALHAEAGQDSAAAGRLLQGTQVDILDRQGNAIPPEAAGQGNLLTEQWFRVRGEGADGQSVEGWAPESRIRVREEDAAGNPIAGSVRRRRGAGADPLTDVRAEPNENAAPVGQLDARAEVVILDRAILEVWFLVRGGAEGQEIEGWVPSRYVQVFGESERGRIARGNTGTLTSDFIRRMVSDRFFWPALRTTALLMVLIIPAQFVLAIAMALIVQARLKGSSLFLYVFTIPLGISELAVGILWFSIFTRTGFLNSALQGLGLIDAPATYLAADSRHWIIAAIWLAEIWRATSIVMVIVVSGLQAISDEVLEAAEVFGASFWQRVRYVILPMLKPSLQVALILRTILALQVFAVVIALSGGDVVTVLANESYRQYTEFRNNNVAAAYAGLILLLSMGSAILYLRTVRTQEELAA